MKRIRTAGVCLAAAPAVFAFAAASAVAANHQPEFGHCVKKVGGKFKNSGCSVAAAPGEEKFEWEPGLTKAVTFTAKTKELTSATLETVTGTKIVCSQGGGTGEGTGEIEAGNPATHVGNVKLLLKGCTTGSLPCTSEGKAEGEIETFPLSGGIGIEKVGTTPPVNNKVAEEWRGAGGGPFLVCSFVGIRQEVRGSLLHKIAANKMTNTTTEKFTAKMGEQKPDGYAGGVLDEHSLESSVQNGPFEEFGVSVTLVETLSEKVEVNTVTGAECALLPCHS